MAHIQTYELSEEDFRLTFEAPMRDVTREATNVIDIWPYVACIPEPDLRGHRVYDQFVEYVYRDARGRFDHVLIMTRTKNVYLAVIVDVVHDCIRGHRLLDLNEEFGLPTPR